MFKGHKWTTIACHDFDSERIHVMFSIIIYGYEPLTYFKVVFSLNALARSEHISIASRFLWCSWACVVDSPLLIFTWYDSSKRKWVEMEIKHAVFGKSHRFESLKFRVSYLLSSETNQQNKFQLEDWIYLELNLIFGRVDQLFPLDLVHKTVLKR